MYLEVDLMIMDALILAIFVISIFVSMRRGLALMLTGLVKGIVSAAVAWFFCGDMALYLLKIQPIHDFAVGKISRGLSYRWENSSIYEALPSLFTSEDGGFAGALITEGASKLAWLFLTILSFLFIFIALRLLATLIQKLFSHKNRGGFVGFSDRLLGMILGIVIGIFNVLLFLALLLPVCGLIVPSLSAQLPGWFSGSVFAKDLYDNNLLLVLLRDFIA